ncbi:phosphatase PAP2 family protein [Telmatospirillum siberiense]|uniref:PA-phosphatase n=1 Tax=Telmatospirillum siberiense TaxID=382514 RepID=A0A2N3PPW3_9PROT|nr:phosphatase PAP2 family protein [Telmatospirillum siberiense]PKU22436.1 PA-phosphatase [Telmatospirillum siberiense]
MSFEHRSAAAKVLIWGFACAVLVGFSIAFLDRGIATWTHGHFHGVRFFVWLTWLVEPVPYLAAGTLAGLAVAMLCGWRPDARGRQILACCLATLVALAFKEQLKYCFGRTWPETWVDGNPSWIGQGVFSFLPFHGGRGWASFPSGHTTAAAAPMSVLWMAFPRLRWIWAGFVLLVAAGLLGADYHWLSDIIAGAFLGTACGAGMSALMRGAKPMGIREHD